VWLSSNVTTIKQEPTTNKWNVSVTRANGEKRTLTVNHVIFATGLGSGSPNTPSYPGMVSTTHAAEKMSCVTHVHRRKDGFKGEILHSSEHKKASDHTGKKVVVVGACTSGMRTIFVLT